MDPNAKEPVSPSSANPLANLEGVVDAAKQAAAAQTTAPVEAPPETPQGQFENQFGLGQATPPVAESTPGLDAVLKNLETPSPVADTPVPQPSTDNLAPEQTQPIVEPLAQPEPKQTPAERLKQQIADSVDAFLKEVTQGQGVTS